METWAVELRKCLKLALEGDCRGTTQRICNSLWTLNRSLADAARARGVPAEP